MNFSEVAMISVIFKNLLSLFIQKFQLYIHLITLNSIENITNVIDMANCYTFCIFICYYEII